MDPARRTTLSTSRSFRPHNKSTLWDEFLEHYDKEKKYFNTKHKKAFCKRCIDTEIHRLAASTENRSRGEEANVLEGWEDWKFREAFEHVEAISGRSSNMQRHIRTCRHISNTERSQIMERFEASQTAPPVVSPSLNQPAASAHTTAAVAAAASDNDTDSSTTTSSPVLSSREGFHARMEPPPRVTQSPAPKFSLKSILNEVPDDVPASEMQPALSPRGGDYKGKTAGRSSTSVPAMQPMAHPAGSQGQVSPQSDWRDPGGDGELVARLDHAVGEIVRVRSRLTNVSDSGRSRRQLPEGHGSPPAATDSLVPWLRSQLEMLRRENDELRLNYSAVKEHNAVLLAKLERYRQRLQEELSDPGDESYEEPVVHGRSRSAPTLFAPETEAEQIKKRKLGKSGESGS